MSEPDRTLRASSPEPTSSSGTLRALVFGQRMATGPSTMSRASCSIWPSSWYDDGAKIVMPGTFVSSAMSSTPWCDGPSSPVMPARSRQKMTGCACRPTSYMTWSMARVRNVE